MSGHPRRRASDQRLRARAGALVVRGWHGWLSHSRETISPGAALGLIALSVALFLQTHNSGQVATDARHASVDAKAAVLRVEQVAKDTAALATQTNTALCALRIDLERRVAISRQLLEGGRVPQAFRDIDPKTIQQSLRNQQATIRSLSILVCD